VLSGYGFIIPPSTRYGAAPRSTPEAFRPEAFAADATASGFLCARSETDAHNDASRHRWHIVRLLIRHLLSVAALPFVVLVAVPMWLARRNGTTLAVGGGGPQIVAQIAGLVLGVIGLLLFASSLRRFATEGDGTLAPWDPPRRLVLRGPYRYVRNPMISGVVFVLFAESLVLLSQPHLAWALVFLGLNAVYIPLLEEPRLARRFGSAYADYRHHVPRFVPRLRPWDSQQERH
jgi:protein-S-isoprenylcysteine O-methyltransferase Ste14